MLACLLACLLACSAAHDTSVKSRIHEHRPLARREVTETQTPTLPQAESIKAVQIQPDASFLESATLAIQGHVKRLAKTKEELEGSKDPRSPETINHVVKAVKIQPRGETSATVGDIGNHFCNISKSASDGLFHRLPDIYVASADPVNPIEHQFQQIPVERRRPAVYATVIGGLGGLNGLVTIQPQEQIIFYDVNEYSVIFCKMVIELIKGANSREEFFNLFYGRNMAQYLLDNPLDNPVDFENAGDRDPLDVAQDKSIIAGALAMLPKEMHCAYAFLQEEYMTQKANLSSAPRNCEQLKLFFDPDSWPPLKPGESHVGSSLNTCTFYYGHGWLRDEDAYARVRGSLTSLKVDFLIAGLGNVIKVAASHGVMHKMRSIVMYTSNIQSFVGPAAFQNLVHDEQTQGDSQPPIIVSLPSPVRGQPISSTSFLSSEPQACAGNSAQRGEAHAFAWNAVHFALAGATGSDVLEVASKVPWGFFEISGRQNIPVADYISSSDAEPKPVVILHILVGEAVLAGNYDGKRDQWQKALMKATSMAQSILILEHNGESTDWVGQNPQHGMFTFSSLRQELGKNAALNDWDVSGCLVPASSADRNLLFVLHKHQTHIS